MCLSVDVKPQGMFGVCAIQKHVKQKERFIGLRCEFCRDASAV